MTDTEKSVCKVFIKAPITAVWNEITKTDEPISAFFGSRLTTPGLRPGAPIRMRTASGKHTGVVGEVLDWDPPNRFSHTFKFTALDEPACKVTYELVESRGGVEFTLVSEDIPPGTKTEKYMKQGGEFIVNTLKGVLENGKPPFKSRFILLMCRLSEPFSPKRCRSENWV